MRQLSIGFHSNSDLSAPFFRIIATPSRWSSSSRPEYNTVSPDIDFNLPVSIPLLSLTPNICKLYRLISVVTCASFPVSYMVRTFQKPILVLVFALITSNFMPVVSFWLSPLVVIRFEDLGRSACRILVVFVAVSVTNSFYRDVNTRDVNTPAGIALGVAGTHKPLSHDKATVPVSPKLKKTYKIAKNVTRKL